MAFSLGFSFRWRRGGAPVAVDAACLVDTPARGERGVTLIESLIALVLLAIALLGVASLQLLAQREEVDARWRSMAATMGSDLFEQLRLAPEDLEDLTLDGGALGGCSTTTQTLCGHIAAWQSTLATRLPNSQAKLELEDLGGQLTRATLSIVWRRATQGASNECRQTQVMDERAGGCIRLETVL